MTAQPGGRPGTRSTAQRATTYVVVALLLFYDLVATGWLGFNERVVAMCRNLVFPGLGFVEFNLWLMALFVVLTVAVVAAWMRWGTDWLAAVVWVSAVVIAFVTVPTQHTHAATAAAGAAVDAARDLPILRASHEFAAVLVLVAVLNRARLMVAGVPGVRRLVARRAAPAGGSLVAAGAVDRARAGAILAVAVRAGAVNVDASAVVDALGAPGLERRARRVGAWARWRFTGDPLRADNAHARAALVLWGLLAPEGVERFRAECRRHAYGVPASEPTWVRPLDGMLAAIALDHLGEAVPVARWRATFAEAFRLRHGHRRGSLHTPTMLGIGTAPPWEHAASTALARSLGWLGDDDWVAVRHRCLGAAARGARTTEDARLVAAGRIWAHLLDDRQAVQILSRPSRSGDAVAVALHHLGDALAVDPAALLQPAA